MFHDSFTQKNWLLIGDCRLQSYSQFPLFVFILCVDFRVQFFYPQSFESHQIVLPPRGGTQNLETFHRWSLFAFLAVFCDRLALLCSMLISTGFEMSTCEANIARLTA